MKKASLIFVFIVFIFNLNTKAQNTLPANGKVGLATTTPKEQLQIGDRWTFHNGGSKFIGYNTFYDVQDKRIFAEGASQIRFHGNGDMLFRTAGTGPANSAISFNPSFIIQNTGNIGIGTENPSTHIHIVKDDPTIHLEDNATSAGSPDKGFLRIAESNGTGRLISDQSVAIFLDSDNNDADDSGKNLFQIISNNSWMGGAAQTNFRVWGNGNTEISRNLKVAGDTEISGKVKLGPWEISQEGGGNVTSYLRFDRWTGDGTSSWKEKKIAVDWSGMLFCKGVTVTVNSFPDYVFDSTYQLLPLKELELFIKTNKHLPEVPDESQVKTDGLDLGQMNTILLKKIEELTLYIIDQQKQIDELRELTKATNVSQKNKK
jgi:hypothetical protein